jgi:peptidase M23-like protein
MPTPRSEPGKSHDVVFTGIVLALGLMFAGSAHADKMSATPQSHGIYRLPFADRTHVRVFWDFTTHRPPGRVDLLAIGGSGPYRVVAAAAGRVVAIEDRFSKRQVGGPGVVCHQNYVWVAHPNGEWTNYSHLAHGSVTRKAHLKVGDPISAGQYLGDEGEVGCAMLKHVHFEVAVPDLKDPIDEGGFLKDNENAKRERNPRFCGVSGHNVIEGFSYTAGPCRKGASGGER